jgi:hypothetical protein
MLLKPLAGHFRRVTIKKRAVTLATFGLSRRLARRNAIDGIAVRANDVRGFVGAHISSSRALSVAFHSRLMTLNIRRQKQERQPTLAAFICLSFFREATARAIA